MHIEAKLLYGFSAVARDGTVGLVRDFIFDETSWQLRYVVVDSGEFVGNRTYLLAMGSVQQPDMQQSILRVNESRTKVFESPAVTTDLPLSRQYLVALHRFYEWPTYWGQVSFLDTADIKQQPQQLPYDEDIEPDITYRDAPQAYGEPLEDEDSALSMSSSEPDEADVDELEFGQSEENVQYHRELRSCSEVSSYAVRTSDEALMAAQDFVLNTESWSIDDLVVRTGFGAAEKKVLVALQLITHIRWAAAHIDIVLSRSELEGTPSYHSGKSEFRAYVRQLYNYYDQLDIS